MFLFGFSPFYWFVPLIMFGIIARVAVRFFRGISGREDRYDRSIYYDPYRRSVEPEGPRRLARPTSYQSRIFKLAYRLHGRVTLSDIIVETGLSIEEAEQVVEKMVDNVHVRMEVDNDGGVTYEFPEIIRRFEGG